MSLNHVKAPEELKAKTIELMKKERSTGKMAFTRKIALIAACVTVLTSSALGYSLFSGIDGDEVSFETSYKGGGIVEIAVTNLSQKVLEFDERVILERRSTDEEIFEVKQDMPKIEPGELSVIEVAVPKDYISSLEAPIEETDGYHFLLTTNNFAFGQTWMTSLTFGEVIDTGDEGKISLPIYPIEDNTDMADIDFIKNHFVLQSPLEEIIITSHYNDYVIEREGVEDMTVHAEIDLFAAEGTEFLPITSGTVTDAGFDAAYGNYIVIDHGNGLVSRYNHCAEIYVEAGDVVELGTAVGTAGKTGMATGTHLGLSVTLDGVAVNPEKVIGE